MNDPHTPRPETYGTPVSGEGLTEIGERYRSVIDSSDYAISYSLCLHSLANLGEDVGDLLATIESDRAKLSLAVEALTPFVDVLTKAQEWGKRNNAPDLNAFIKVRDEEGNESTIFAADMERAREALKKITTPPSHE